MSKLALKMYGNMLKVITGKIKLFVPSARMCTSKLPEGSSTADKFETVYSFPHIKYLALFNRLKAYHIVGSSIAVPCSGLLELLNIFPHQSFWTAAYIGVTGAGVLSVASLPFNNTIGFLYISDDDKKIKISSLNFWGKRVDRIVPVDDWIPLLDTPPKMMDAVFLSPQLADSTNYKWFVKFGNVLDSKRIGQILE